MLSLALLSKITELNNFPISFYSFIFSYFLQLKVSIYIYIFYHRCISNNQQNFWPKERTQQILIDVRLFKKPPNFCLIKSGNEERTHTEPSLTFLFHMCVWMHVCTCMCVGVEARWCCFLGTICLFSPRSGPLQLGQTGWPAIGIHLSPPHRPRIARKCQPTCFTFLILVLESKCRCSRLHNKYFTYWAIAPAWHFSMPTFKPTRCK